MKKEMVALINQVPAGRVISFGVLAEQINMLTNETTSGWMVGRLLSSMPIHEWNSCPWWRVINKEGFVSSLKLGQKGIEQINLLRSEGVEVDTNGYVNMALYGWRFDGKNVL